MNADRKSWFTYKRLIALIVIIPAVLLIIFTIIIPNIPGKGESTPIPFTI